MKIWKKIKKSFLAVWMFFMTLPMKVFGLKSTQYYEELYGIPPTPLYGIEEPEPDLEKIKTVLEIIRIAVIPLVLIIGIIVYLKKSKNKKFVNIVALVMVAICVYLIMGKIIEGM